MRGMAGAAGVCAGVDGVRADASSARRAPGHDPCDPGPRRAQSVRWPARRHAGRGDPGHEQRFLPPGTGRERRSAGLAGDLRVHRQRACGGAGAMRAPRGPRRGVQRGRARQSRDAGAHGHRTARHQRPAGAARWLQFGAGGSGAAAGRWRQPGALRRHAGHAARAVDGAAELLPGPLRATDAGHGWPCPGADQRPAPGRGGACAGARERPSRHRAG